MKKENVKTGQQYTAQIDGKLTMLEIVAEHPKGGWIGRDMFTRKKRRRLLRPKNRLRANRPPSRNQRTRRNLQRTNACRPWMPPRKC
jgi:hypothetical protein